MALSCLVEVVRRRLRVPVVFDTVSFSLNVDKEEIGCPCRMDVYSSNADTAAFVKVALNVEFARPAFTRFVVSTGAIFQRLRTTYFEDAIAMSLEP